MRKVFMVMVAIAYAAIAGAQTIEQCYQWAQENYPLIKQYELVEKSTRYSLATAAKAWLPQIVLSGQATYQSDVVAFPTELDDLYKKMGIDFEGLHKDQYKFALDVNQTIWDGGATKARSELAKAEGAMQEKSIEIQLYAIKERINSLYFGILILQEQRNLNNELQGLLKSNIERVSSLVDGGVATQGDSYLLEAELLGAEQNAVSIEASLNTYKAMLELFTNHKLDSLEIPAEPLLGNTLSQRPEYDLFNLRLKAIDAQNMAVNSSLYPRISAFGQGFYGNPGLNMFEDMLHSHFSWNYIVGLRLQMNISSFFHRGNDTRKIELARAQVAADRELFSFNNMMQSQSRDSNIESKRKIIQRDNEIISLREAVRKSTESKVEGGVAGVNDLSRDITAENQARISAVTHRIELLKYIYDQKTLTNN